LSPSLCAAHKENQTFLHARFGLAEDVLEPYKKIIDRWLWPDVSQRQDTSVSPAERTISDYKNGGWRSGGIGRADGFLLRAFRWVFQRHCE
jgi:hypothetical protein